MGTYTIKQGNHYDDRWFSTFPWIGRHPRSIKFYVRFHRNCLYELPAYNRYDVNKLFGLSFGFRGQHWNSARYGWYSEGNLIALAPYCYIEGKRNQDTQLRFPVIGMYPVEEWIACEIIADNENRQYEFRTQLVGSSLVSTVTVKHGLQLLPFGFTHSLYFGGEKVSPQDVSCEMMESLPN